MMNWSSLFTSISCLLQYKRISDLYYRYSFFLLERRDGELARVALDDANDNAENTQSRSENLYNQNLYEQGGILRISNGTGRTGNADRNSRRDVGKADGKAGRKHAVTGVVIAVPVPVIVKIIGGLVGLLNLVCQNDGHDDTVNGGGLAKNDTDEILRSDAGCLNGGTDKTASGQPYSPRRTDDAQSQTEGDAEVGIAVRRHVGEDLAPPGVAVLRLTGVVRHCCVL
mmetsp:Transcript_10947/g.18242  ORF Transcript_10947/g.18242 Transcript_10947/m.18242 type:complete len:227 (-) Transcript_10947:36-716(-)